MSFLEQYEGPIRLGVFLGGFLLLALVEILAPRRKRSLSRLRRWVTNGTLVVINTGALRIIMPVLAVGAAQIAAIKGWGLFAYIGLPLWVEIILSVIILDMLIYTQHVLMHRVPFLWALHKVHHFDRDFDVTTGFRFHPAEIIFSMGYKLGFIFLLGPPALGVFIFEILLNASSMFNHANIRLPLGVDQILRGVIVTPDMHRVHHSILPQETNSNYGFFLSIWDRVFKTYRDQPEKGHEQMTIGLSENQTEKPGELVWSLTAPLR